jgi:RNA polymerase sigma-70 factor (ECF subfamily)
VTTLPRHHLLPADGEARIVTFLPGGKDSFAMDARACNRTALIAAYGELAPRIHRFVRDLLGDASLSSDATQETFVRALRKVDGLPPATPLVPWVFGVARRVSLELVRARGRGRRVLVEGEPSHDQVADASARSPEAALLDREALGIVEHALARLPEARRAALLLRLDHGLTYEEIGAAMGWSLAKTKIEIFRGRAVLRGTFEEWRGGGVP